MANKYKTFSRQARRANSRLKMCEAKKAFNSADEAAATGNAVYECPHCGKFHTSAQHATLVNTLRNRAERRHQR